ncbi:MAG: FlgO family outer membrane protein [Steroidobacteraceae bacterium]
MSDRIRLSFETLSAAILIAALALPAQGRVVKAVSPIVVAQADEPKPVRDGGAGYEVALHSLASKLVLQLQSAGQTSATVLDFTDMQGQGTELGRFLAQELSDQLVAGAKTLSLVDRANLQFLLKENKLSMEGLVDPRSTRKLGNMIGIDTVIMGTVTPLGNIVRLSVRAVAVETGKIVAAQSITVSAAGGLGEMYTHGVANGSTGPSQQGDVSSRPNVRDRLRADSFKLIPGELVANSNAYNGSQISFSIENHSGIGVGVAIRAGATSAGPCNAWDAQTVGLAVINDNEIEQLSQSPEPTQHLRWFPANARVSVSTPLNAYQCPAMLQGVPSVPLTVNLVVASGKDVVILPLSADRVPVRLVRNQ